MVIGLRWGLSLGFAVLDVVGAISPYSVNTFTILRCLSLMSSLPASSLQMKLHRHVQYRSIVFRKSGYLLLRHGTLPMYL